MLQSPAAANLTAILTLVPAATDKSAKQVGTTVIGTGVVAGDGTSEMRLRTPATRYLPGAILGGASIASGPMSARPDVDPSSGNEICCPGRIVQTGRGDVPAGLG